MINNAFEYSPYFEWALLEEQENQDEEYTSDHNYNNHNSSLCIGNSSTNIQERFPMNNIDQNTDLARFSISNTSLNSLTSEVCLDMPPRRVQTPPRSSRPPVSFDRRNGHKVVKLDGIASAAFEAIIKLVACEAD